MNGRWPRVRLGEVLRRSSETVAPEPDATYQEVTVRLWGKGVVKRGAVQGAQLAGQRRFTVRAGQFILSRIDARNGAFGLVPPELNDAVVSNDFPAFDVDRTRLDPDYLGWLSKTASFVAMCRNASEGTTNRVRLSEPKFLAVTVPLPPLPEQQRIVARVSAVVEEMGRTRSLQQQAVADAEALEAALLVALVPPNVPIRPLRACIAPDTTISYGVLVPGPDCNGGVPFVRVQDLSLGNAAEQPNKRIAPAVDAKYARTRLRGGEILVGVVGSIGKIGTVPASWAGANIARAVCRIVPGPEIDGTYLALILAGAPAKAYFREATRTLAQPTLNVAQLGATPIPLPSLDVQRRVVAAHHRIQIEMTKLCATQRSAIGDLNALLPALLRRAFA